MAELEGRSVRGVSGNGGSAWGGGHLALDAIVAYVDEELSSGAKRRALEHLSGCRECAGEVVAQTQARLALRASSAPSLPSNLMHNLRGIPLHAELPEPPAGLSVGADGQLFEIQRAPRPSRRRHPDRWVRLGAGAVMSGLAIGALVVVNNTAVNQPAPVRGPNSPSSSSLPAGGAPRAAMVVTPRRGSDAARSSAPSSARVVPVLGNPPAGPRAGATPVVH
ncbi:MAG TPA: zf-HC2 domain-containing protein [Pseudonocardia sp.]|jgi:anti-sigma factor RsiW|nr:zf-HC2 domain-containing protein [Pseudonocardia sp.]